MLNLQRPNPSEHHFTIEHLGILDNMFRGYYSHSPKRLNVSSLLQTMVLTTNHRHLKKVNKILVLSNHEEIDFEKLQQSLASIAPAVYENFTPLAIRNLFSDATGENTLVCAAFKESPTAKREFAQLRTTLKINNFKASHKLWTIAKQHLKNDFSEPELVYEESTGKYYTLQVGYHSLKASRRQFEYKEKDSADKLVRSLMESSPETGWGGICFYVRSLKDEPTSTNENSCRVYQVNIPAQFSEFDLNFPEKFYSIIETWLRDTCKMSMNQLRTIQFSIPSFAVTASLIEYFSDKNQETSFSYWVNDLIYGWLPTMSILSTLNANNTDKPILFCKMDSLKSVEIWLVKSKES